MEVGGPQLMSVYMSVYFTIYTFSNFLFIMRNFFSTHASTTENVVLGVLTLDPLISNNIPSQLVPEFWRHVPYH